MANLGLLLGKIGVSLLTSLITEAFAKRLLLIAAESIAKKTENGEDDRVVQAVREAWGVRDSE